MKKINLLIMLFVCCISNNLYAQIKIDTTNAMYFNEFAKGHRTYVTKFKITNDSEEVYLTWLLWAPIKGESEERRIVDTFRNRRLAGTQCLLNMIGKEETLNSPIRIPFSFLKMIMPGESFEYLIVSKNDKSTFYQDRIMLFPLDMVNDALNTVIMSSQNILSPDDKWLDEMLYKDTSLVLVDENN